MPETPDFERIAQKILYDSDGEPGGSRIAEQLRQVWNARGAADVDAVDAVAHTNYEAVANAIRAFDR
jgi:hypothetical protein